MPLIRATLGRVELSGPAMHVTRVMHAMYGSDVRLLHAAAAAGPVNAYSKSYSGQSGAVWPCNACVSSPGRHFLFSPAARAGAVAVHCLSGTGLCVGYPWNSVVSFPWSGVCEHVSAREGALGCVQGVPQGLLPSCLCTCLVWGDLSAQWLDSSCSAAYWRVHVCAGTNV
jgi:hypothetical protein